MICRPAFRTWLLVAIAWGSGAAIAAPQEPKSTDTLHLAAVQDAAVRNDPRAAQLELLRAQGELRLRSLRAERLPSVGLQGQAQLQSDVPSLPLELPGGVRPPVPPKDSYDAHLHVRQSLYDPSLGPRRRLEEARRVESQARVRSTLHEIRLRTNQAYFAVLLLRMKIGELETALTRIQAQLEVASSREAEGAALPSEAMILRRELMRRRQMLEDLETQEMASREILGALSGRRVEPDEILALPELAAAVRHARARLRELRSRPEYERFALGREVLQRQREAVAARDLPRVFAFGRTGYGRPGLNPLATTLDSYWLGGLRVEWSPWRWGATENERQELSLASEILASEEAAFVDELERASITELAAIDRVESALQRDHSIVELSEEILSEARLRFAESVITSAELVEREAELLDARLARIAHEIELAHARTRFLTLIGYDLP